MDDSLKNWVLKTAGVGGAVAGGIFLFSAASGKPVHSAIPATAIATGIVVGLVTKPNSSGQPTQQVVVRQVNPFERDTRSLIASGSEMRALPPSSKPLSPEDLDSAITQVAMAATYHLQGTADPEIAAQIARGTETIIRSLSYSNQSVTSEGARLAPSHSYLYREENDGSNCSASAQLHASSTPTQPDWGFGCEGASGEEISDAQAPTQLNPKVDPGFEKPGDPWVDDGDRSGSGDSGHANNGATPAGFDFFSGYDEN